MTLFKALGEKFKPEGTNPYSDMIRDYKTHSIKKARLTVLLNKSLLKLHDVRIFKSNGAVLYSGEDINLVISETTQNINLIKKAYDSI